MPNRLTPSSRTTPGRAQASIAFDGRHSGLRCRYDCTLDGRPLSFRRPNDETSVAALLKAAGDRDRHELAEHGRVFATRPAAGTGSPWRRRHLDEHAR